RPAIHQLHAAIEHELVAFRVTAEIIVVVEDQDAAVCPRGGQKKVRCCETAYAPAHHDEIEALAGVASRLDCLAVAQRVGRLERAWMRAAQPREQRWIVRRTGLRPSFRG